MVDVLASPERTVRLGRLGENEHTRVLFDITDYLAAYPDASFYLLNRLPTENTAYPVAEIETDEQYVYWTVTSSALIHAGIGQCELVVRDGEVIAKSVIFMTEVLDALDDNGPVPDPWSGWIDHFEECVQEANQCVIDANAAKTAAQEAQAAAEEHNMGVTINGNTLVFSSMM